MFEWFDRHISASFTLLRIHANQSVRAAALETLVSLNDPRLAVALCTAARDAGLEGSPLLQAVEDRVAARRESIKFSSNSVAPRRPAP